MSNFLLKMMQRANLFSGCGLSDNCTLLWGGKAIWSRPDPISSAERIRSSKCQFATVQQLKASTTEYTYILASKKWAELVFWIHVS